MCLDEMHMNMSFKGMRVCKRALTTENCAKAKDRYKDKDKEVRMRCKSDKKELSENKLGKAKKQLMLVIPRHGTDVSI